MKFVRPGYRLLNSVDRRLALATFDKFKDTYHPICKALVKQDLDWIQYCRALNTEFGTISRQIRIK
ncbi:AVN_HP_G0125930.mRNA.1.CDS.1 [Saccharomyces cerevisiae]|nr:AVN_HP_G0125930.mRNA.1.CDS.1 [Saccharomyces cerevisiae]CAI6378203.1 AVN_HP_G0125930.mRNA.1.CDS.1 [Saccharomyces cerevisiae]